MVLAGAKTGKMKLAAVEIEKYVVNCLLGIGSNHHFGSSGRVGVDIAIAENGDELQAHVTVRHNVVEVVVDVSCDPECEICACCSLDAEQTAADLLVLFGDDE